MAPRCLPYSLCRLWLERSKIRRRMDARLQGQSDGWLRPHVDRSLPPAQAAEAQAYIEARRNTGKVVLVV